MSALFPQRGSAAALRRTFARIQICPPLRGQHFPPMCVEPTRRLFGIDVIDHPWQRGMFLAASESHARVEARLPRLITAQHVLDHHPVLAVVLLEHTARAEGPQHADTPLLLRFRCCRVVDDGDCPYLDFPGPARVPNAQRLDTRQERQIRKDRHVRAVQMIGARIAQTLAGAVARRSEVVPAGVRADDAEEDSLVAESLGFTIGSDEEPRAVATVQRTKLITAIGPTSLRRGLAVR